MNIYTRENINLKIHKITLLYIHICKYTHKYTRINIYKYTRINIYRKSSEVILNSFPILFRRFLKIRLINHVNTYQTPLIRTYLFFENQSSAK